MKLTSRSTLSLALAIYSLTIITSDAHPVSNVNDQRWIPIAIDRSSGYFRTNSFIPLDEPNEYPYKIIQDLKKIIITKRNENPNAPISVEKNFGYINNTVKKREDKFIENMQNQSNGGPKEVFKDSTPKLSLTSQSSVISSTSPAIAAPTLRPEVNYDNPLISYSDHATNKSDATAYYPRPNDYYGTRARRLRVGSELNENIDPTSNDSENSKSNNLNSRRRIFKKTAEIERGENSASRLELSQSRSAVNNNNQGHDENYHLKKNNHNNFDFDRNIARNIPNSVLRANTYNRSLIHSGEPIDLHTDHIRSAESINTKDLDVKYLYQDQIFQDSKVQKPNDINQNTFEQHHLKKSGLFSNYGISRTRIHNYFYDQDYRYLYGLPMMTRKIGYNSLNHLPVDPVLAVLLSNYGHYVPGYYGRNVDYANLYGYLASNNIHNNKPFGSYKFSSDKDF